MSPTSYQTALSRANLRRDCPFILSHIFSLYGAENRNRTDTMFNHRRILSPVRLPVPPPRHDIIFSQVAISSISLLALRVGLEPTTYRLTAGCSTIELPKIMWHSANFLCHFFMPCGLSGNILLSQVVANQVSSAHRGLTSVFGMVTGGTLLLWSPDPTSSNFSLVKSSAD